MQDKELVYTFVAKTVGICFKNLIIFKSKCFLLSYKLSLFTAQIFIEASSALQIRSSVHKGGDTALFGKHVIQIIL